MYLNETQTMTIQADYSRTFSYARMQNGMPAVRTVLLKNKDGETLTDVTLTIRFDPPFSSGFETHFSELPKGKTVLDPVRILPSASYLANMTERMEGTMTLSCVK